MSSRIELARGNNDKKQKGIIMTDFDKKLIEKANRYHCHKTLPRKISNRKNIRLLVEKNLVIKEFNRDPMPGHEYLMIGRVGQILDDLQRLADAYGYSTTDRDKVNDLIGKVLQGWSMEFRLRRAEYLRNADRQDKNKKV